MSDEKIWPISPKELAIVAPILGGVIAIIYDVGYFVAIGINYFSVFSLSEHLVFAIQASPLIVLAELFIGLFVTIAQLELFKGFGSKVSYIMGLVLMGLAGIAHFGGFFASSAAIFSIGAILFFISPQVRSAAVPILLIALTGIGCAAVLSTGINMGETKLRLSPTEILQTSNQEGVRGILLRSGDRGVLFYDSKNRTVLFLPWDRIVRIAKEKSGDHFRYPF